MNHISKPEQKTQNRIVSLFKNELGYKYPDNFEDQQRTQPIEENLLLDFLIKSQGYSEIIAKKTVKELVKAATNLSGSLYEAKKEVYKLLRYGVSIREELGKLSNYSIISVKIFLELIIPTIYGEMTLINILKQ